MSAWLEQREQADHQQLGGIRQPNFRAKTLLRIFAASAIALAGILIIAIASHPAAKDYISYWSAGHLLMHHGDPYSPAQVFALEKSRGYTEVKPIIMRNPPWAMFLVAPLGFGGPLTGLLLWTAAVAGCILAFALLLDVPAKDRALAFLFAPAFASVCSGQSSPFLLLGFALFLRFHYSRPFLAGASLLLMAIKPHLFLVFWAVLLVDCIYRRRFRILAGGLSALAVATAFALCFDLHIGRQYVTMLRASTLEHEFFPTASMLLRLFIDPRADWLLVLPSALATLWGLWYYAHRRRVWDWRIHGMLLMLVTVLVSPYGWFTDETVLLPSIAFALGCTKQRRYSKQIILAINILALLVLIVVHASLSSPAYIWTPLAWLLWFLYATRGFAIHDLTSTNPLTRTGEIEGV